MIQLADSEEQDLLVAGAGYPSFEDLGSEPFDGSFWHGPVLLFVGVALTLLVFASWYS